MTIGRGIGMGVVVNGVVRGWRGGAGEIGHVEVRARRTRLLVRPARLPRGGRRGTGPRARDPRHHWSARGARTSSPRWPLAIPRVGRARSSGPGARGWAHRDGRRLLDPGAVVVSGEGVRLGTSTSSRSRDGPPCATDDHRRRARHGALGRRGLGAGRGRDLVLRELFHPAHLRDERRPPAAVAAPTAAVPNNDWPGTGRGGVADEIAPIPTRAWPRGASLSRLACRSALARRRGGPVPGPRPAPTHPISGTVTFWNGYAADGDEITTFTDWCCRRSRRSTRTSPWSTRRSRTTTCARSW